MKSSSRWLLAFGVTIGVLVIVALVLVLTMAGKGGAPLLPEDTPEGTVQRYLLALEAEDYQKAYSYLSTNMTYETWRRQIYRSEERPGVKVTLGKSVVKGSEATVDVVVDVFSPGGPFENPVDTHRTTFFLKREGTSWKITSPTYVWWFY